MKLDFSEVKENVLLSEGEHTLTIKKVEEKVSQNGNPMLVVDMAEDEGEDKGGFTRDHICTTGAAAFKMKQFLESLGISEEEAIGMEPSDFVGMAVNVEIAHEEYEDKVFAKVKKYL